MRTTARIGAEEAARLMREQGYVYLDVRTPEEFALGHPAGATNVASHVTTEHGRRERGDTFVREVQERFAKDAKLVVGCQTGERSQWACAQLTAAGYEDVVEQRAGFGGVRDAFGRLVEKGWKALGLPCE